MNEMPDYKHLEPQARSHYRQWFVKGKRIRAEVLYRETVGPEPRTAEDVADDYGVPLDAVREAIDYCERHPGILQADWDREEANYQADRQARGSAHAAGERAAS